MEAPIFIIGNPRSGTTLLRLMINNHKNIIVPPECGFAVWWYSKHKEWTFSKDNLESFIKDLSSSKKIETWNIDFDQLTENLIEIKPTNYASLISAIYSFYGRTRNKKITRWGDKNNFYITNINIIKKIFPKAKFVFIIRDGRDVACSYKKLSEGTINSEYAPKLSSHIHEIAHEWLNNNLSFLSNFDPSEIDSYCITRYEDLVYNPEQELRKICLFLGENFDPEMNNYFIKNKEEEQEPTEFLQWKAKTLERPTTSEVGKFREILSAKEISEFELIALPLLKRFNYL